MLCWQLSVGKSAPPEGLCCLSQKQQKVKLSGARRARESNTKFGLCLATEGSELREQRRQSQHLWRVIHKHLYESRECEYVRLSGAQRGLGWWLGIWLSDSARKFLKTKGFISFFLLKGCNNQSINTLLFVQR